MKILDRYLIRQFLQTIVFGLIAFTALFVIIDLMENMDDFIDQSVPGNFIIEYYIMFVPEILRLMIPVAVLLACLFTVGKLSSQNELTSMKASGLSLYRFMMPFLATGLFISILATAFGGYVVPTANKHKVYIEQTYMKKGLVALGGNIIFQDSKTRIVNILSYSTFSQQANRVSIHEFDEKYSTKMTSRIDANFMRYDSAANNWILNGGTKRTFTDSNETAENFTTMELNNLNFKPDDIIKKQQKPEEQTLDELKEFAEERLRSGNDPTRIEIEYYSRYAFGFASLIVVFFGLPISANKRKGGLAVQFGISLLVTFLYLVFMKVSQAFGKNGVMDPLITAWFANFIFLFIGLVNLIRVQK